MGGEGQGLIMSDLYDVLGINPDDPAVRDGEDDAEEIMHLVEALISIRAASHLTQTDVAERMGTTQSAISDIERLGGDPRVSTLQRYARALDVKLELGIEHNAVDRWEPSGEVIHLAPRRRSVERRARQTRPLISAG